MQLDGILNVFDDLFVRVALAVAALKRGAGNEKTISVHFDDDGKSNVPHDFNHYRSVLERRKPSFVAGREKGRSTHRRKLTDLGAKPVPGPSGDL